MDRPPEVMSDAELVHALDQADATLARIETHRLRLIAAMDTSGYAERIGARDTVQYLEYRYRLDHSRAHRDVHLARALPKYPAVTAALPEPLDDGEAAEVTELSGVVLRPAQAEAIVTALEKVPATVPVADLEVAEQELVRLARHLAPADLRKAAVQARDILDTDGPEPEEHKAAARESLTLTSADRGVKFRGYLANENAELLRTLITTAARPHRSLDGDPDPRSREKRQADALTTTLVLAATALDAGTPSPTIPRPATAARPTNAASAPTGSTDAGSTPAGSTGPGCTAAGSTDAGSTQTVATETVATDGGPAEAGSTAAGGDDGSGGGVVTGAGDGVVNGSGGEVVPGFGAKANVTVTIDLEDLKAATADAIGQTVYSNGLSAATIRRLACDAKVIPIVLGSNSEPLDVGRSQRLVTRAMRRALNTRDRGCVVCGAPPVMCDAHHLISWIDGGDTKTSNLVLLCRRDHTDLHRGHWTITITDGEVHVARPIWADPPTPRHHPSSRPNDTPRTNKPPGRLPTPPEPPDGRPGLADPAAYGGLTRSDSADSRPMPRDRPPGARTATDNRTLELSTPSDPWGETAVPGTTSKRTSQTSTSAGDPQERTSTPPKDPWGETAAPAANPASPPDSPAGPGLPGAPGAPGGSGVGQNRWQSDELTRAEAARFAVWGERATTDTGTGPPSLATT